MLVVILPIPCSNAPMLNQWKVELTTQNINNFVRDHIQAYSKQNTWNERCQGETEHENKLKQDCQKLFVPKDSASYLPRLCLRLMRSINSCATNIDIHTMVASV